MLPFQDWPAADRTAFQALFAKGSPLDERGPLAHWRETSRVCMGRQYGRWLAWVSKQDPKALVLDPVDRATPQRLRNWCLSESDLAPATLLGHVGTVVRLCKYLAPEANFGLHQRLLAHLHHAKTKHGSPRKSGRIYSSEVLLDVGQRLLQENARPDPDLQSAVKIRDGAIICLLALMPMRRRALSELALGTSLRVTSTNMEVWLDASMTKTGQPWDAVVPDAARAALQVYLECARPLLEARGSGPQTALWLGRSGHPMHVNHFTRILCKRTEAYLGTAVSPHLFRDAAATTLARAASGAARMIPPILGHSTTRTAEQHYIQADTIAAGRKLAEALDALKEAPVPKAGSRQRKPKRGGT
ncbi:tyrosine-type recombinase/integrase [Roseovarius aestuariivivens]|uniref:tyrosine-type recombinase/integrase n=1 Tax=Roseovarius aestuariivivens TaxID=1888910 RepID=UPI001FD99CFF|nr:tyrosine-type recombinase/integrase [Roseovarius aestuariivivens]